MFIYSTAKRQRIYHTENCTYARQIHEEHRKYVATAAEAEALGYHACIRCSRTGKAYRREIGKIRKFCRDTGFTCCFRRGCIFIKTPVDSWLLFYSEYKRKFLVFHQNLTHRGEGGPIKGYHRQKWAYSSVYDMLLSIYDHTYAYLEKRTGTPQGLKVKLYRSGKCVPPSVSRKHRDKRKRKEKMEKQKHAVGHVLDLIDYLSSKRDKTDEVDS